MGCRRYFAASRLEVLLDEDDSRSSSRARERGSSLLVSHSEVNVYFLVLSEQTDGLSTHKSHRAYLICVYVSVCVFVFIYTFNRHWHTTLHKSLRAYIGAFAAKQDIFFDLLSKQTGRLLTYKSPVLDFGWICWEFSPPPAISEPNSFIQISLKEIFGGGRSDAYTFSYMISPDSIIITFGIQ